MGGTAAAMEGEVGSWLEDKSCCASSPFLGPQHGQLWDPPPAFLDPPDQRGLGNVWLWMWGRIWAPPSLRSSTSPVHSAVPHPPLLAPAQDSGDIQLGSSQMSPAGRAVLCDC